MPTGSGKTVVALHCIAQRKQPALVIVHTKELLYQWHKEAQQFLGLKDDEVGLLGDRHSDLGKPVTIAIVNSLYTRAEKYRKQTGFLIVDECHRVPSRTFKEAVAAFDSRYMLGLSATPQRRDGLNRLIYLSLGDRVCNVSQKKLQAAGHIMGADLVTRETGFDYPYDDDYQAMLTALTGDPARNQLIVNDFVDFARDAPDPALMVSDRKEHCNVLAELIRERGIRVAVLTGDTPKNARTQVIEDLNAGKLDVLVSTIQLIGEGFNCKRLAALFLATPSRFAGKIQQVVGRVLRSDNGKSKPVIYDYADQSWVLRASFESRLETYQKLGVTFPN
jgi:superfamily II DNA or RNA helicase